MPDLCQEVLTFITIFRTNLLHRLEMTDLWWWWR